jgi:hypothetical protein
MTKSKKNKCMIPKSVIDQFTLGSISFRNAFNKRSKGNIKYLEAKKDSLVVGLEWTAEKKNVFSYWKINSGILRIRILISSWELENDDLVIISSDRKFIFHKYRVPKPRD